jgi:hypothetical protein
VIGMGTGVSNMVNPLTIPTLFFFWFMRVPG